MIIDREGLLALSRMARVPIAESEFEARLADIQKILAFVQQIESVQIPDDLEMVYPISDVARNDVVMLPALETVESIREQFPDRVGNHLSVSKVLKK
jgi:Asp-tRNA(Asn)/Glu-tRNA(Gln) amidotransferase C subunit